jgi:hypothetical protein
MWIPILAIAFVGVVQGGWGAQWTSNTVTLSEEEVQAFIRELQATSPTAGREDFKLEDLIEKPDLSACYGFPFRECIYEYWLESGALGVIVPIERELGQLRDQHRRVAESEEWSASLQNRLDEIDNQMTALETKRDDTLAKAAEALEATGQKSIDVRVRAAVFRMAQALNDLEAGRAKKALESLDHARDHLPDEPLVHVLRGIALRESGQAESAFDELRDAVSRQPHLVLGVTTLAQANEDRLEFDQAARLWAQAARAPLAFTKSLEQWVSRNRERFPKGAQNLRRVWAEHYQLRMRLARLRHFASEHYLEYEKSGYRVVYDPSIGVPLRREELAPLQQLVQRYIEGGDGAVDPEQVRTMFKALSRMRDNEMFARLMSAVTDELAAAESNVGQALNVKPRGPALVVLHNPMVWESLIAPRGVLGLYQPHGRLISLPVSPAIDRRELQHTVHHEYAHFVTFDLTGPRELPLWLVEGLAEHLALAATGREEREDDPLTRERLELARRARVELPWFAKGRESFDAADYEKARRAVALLDGRFGASALYDLLEALGQGEDLDGASHKALQMSYREVLRWLVKQLPSSTL